MTDPARIEFVPTSAKFFPAARAALASPLFVSHRSETFSALFEKLRKNLKELSGGNCEAVIACGSGTWANELAAQNFARGKKSVLTLVNGEFGARLDAQVRRACGDAAAQRLDFGWGEPFSEKILRERLVSTPECRTIFCVACETSWGGLNDLAMLDRAAREHGAEIVLDAMSAVGFSPKIFAFPSVRAVTASSGKGLAGVPGIALLFLRGKDPPAPRGGAESVPASLDLAAHLRAMRENAPLNTLSSFLVQMLNASVEEILRLGQENYRTQLLAAKAEITEIFRRRGFETFPRSDSPMITAFRRADDDRANSELDAALARANIEIYGRPKYLRERRLFEVAAMGDFSGADIAALASALR